MTRPAERRPFGRRVRLAGTVLLVALGSAPLVGAAPAHGAVRSADAAGTTSPLQVSLDTLRPATIPPRGRLTITGRITNRSQDTWTGLNAYLLTSSGPITSRADLARAAATDADTPVGQRRTGTGLYDKVGDLAPGQSTGYRLSVRRADLGISGRPGVYWVGVHVLGAVDGARDSVADGRARTFMPLLPATDTPAGRQARTRLALVVPVRQAVRRGPTARLLDTAAWSQTLGSDGRLDRLLALSGQSRSGLTWVVDPAVLDAVQSVANGNPPLDAGPAKRGAGRTSTSAPGATTAAGGPLAPGAGTGSGGSGAPGPSATEARARAWLADFARQSGSHTVLSLPYGDLDVASVLASPVRTLYDRATSLSRAALTAHGVSRSNPVVDPSGGYLPSTVRDQVDPGTTTLLDAAAAPGAAGPVLPTRDRSPVVLSDPQAGAGGPQADARYAALAVRQRLLSEAALHALSAARSQPVVVTMPDDWDPGSAWDQAAFFTGLRQPWLQLVDLPSVVSTATTTGAAAPASLFYPASQAAADLPVANMIAARRLVRTGGLFARLLTNNDTVDDQLARVAVLAAATAARADPAAAVDRTDATTGYVRSQIDRVHVVGPPFVMMSGESGPIQVTLVNDLPETVTAGLAITTPGSDLRIAKYTPVTLGPGRRTTARLEASSDDIGVHSVTLQVTDAKGVPLGSSTQFNVRTSHVSTVIWVVMAIGAGLLLLTIGVRLLRRLRRRRATHGPLLSRPGISSGAAPGSAREHRG